MTPSEHSRFWSTPVSLPSEYPRFTAPSLAVMYLVLPFLMLTGTVLTNWPSFFRLYARCHYRPYDCGRCHLLAWYSLTCASPRTLFRLSGRGSWQHDPVFSLFSLLLLNRTSFPADVWPSDLCSALKFLYLLARWELRFPHYELQRLD